MLVLQLVVVGVGIWKLCKQFSEVQFSDIVYLVTLLPGR
jgi:hypothetical protein